MPSLLLRCRVYKLPNYYFCTASPSRPVRRKKPLHS